MCFNIRWYDDTSVVAFQQIILCDCNCMPWELYEKITLHKLTLTVKHYEEKLLTSKDVVIRWIDESSSHPRATSFEIDIDQIRGMIQNRLKYLDGIDTI